MKYDFDSPIDRYNTNSLKWDLAEDRFGVKDILPLWVADMDFRAPQPVIDAMRKTAERGVYGYSCMSPCYYEVVIDWMKRRHKWDIRQEWFVFSPGVVTALHMLVRAFASPGDQVIVQTPVYYPFFNAINENDCELLDNPLLLDDGHYAMDLADLKAKITSRTRMIILCNPHNPIARVWRREELAALGEICLEHDILVISDEIHADLVYEGHQHVPFASLSPELADNCVVCTSASKTFNIPGLQVSNIIIPNPRLRQRFQNVTRAYGIHFPNFFGIIATEAAYRYGEPWLEQLLDYLEGNIAFLTEFAAERIPGLRITEPQGTYLLWLDFRGCGLAPSRLGDFVRNEAKVALQPGTMFGCREIGFERMNIACPRSTLSEGLHRIERALSRG